MVSRIKINRNAANFSLDDRMSTLSRGEKATRMRDEDDETEGKERRGGGEGRGG
jgi:hypothetical protein